MIKKIIKHLTVILLLAVLAVAGFLAYRNYTQMKQVHTFDGEIETAVQKYHLTGQKELVAAIIWTESKGKGTDVMQSSESVYGNPGEINSSQESIDYGVQHLKQAIDKATEAGVGMDTAIQAYNFGLDYINYVKKNGGKNTVKLAEKYSRDVLSPMLGNQNKTKYRYFGLHSLLYNGGYLYHNGGNFFYAKVVRFNQWKLEKTSFLF